MLEDAGHLYPTEEPEVDEAIGASSSVRLTRAAAPCGLVL